MMLFSCFSPLVGGNKKKRSKESNKYLDLKKGETNVKPRVKPIDLPEPASNGNLNRDDPAAADAAYEGGDEHDEIISMKMDYSDLDIHDSNQEFIRFAHELFDNKSERDGGITPDLLMQSGNVSDPGMGQKETSWGSPVLKRSCSNIETKRRNLQTISSSTKSQSYTDLKNVSADGNSLYRNQSSPPLSAKSNCSADRVMLKKRSSSQVLPSRSRKVWWKLFLLSHRNLHLPAAFSKPPLPTHQKAGYSSDTLEPTRTPEKGKKKAVEESANQWVAFAMDSSSPMDRINAWVSSIEETEFCPMHDNDDADSDEEEETKGGFFFVNSPVVGESSGKNHSTHAGRRTMEEIMQANHVIQSLNSLSSVAHISGMGLKVIPSISAFSSLRTVNLSGNFIVQINPGSLPKSLHTLDLSRNKIATIEGLRGLTRLRVLNLSYNRISRIGHGLSDCTLIKEFYIAGNKISNVEGLHRLLKLSVLDLSFNKITTAKALGQLVANYHSLLALNLVGNPVQANIGDDQLRKTATSLLPHLTYLNRQPIKPQRAREAATDSLAKAALGSGSSGGRRTGRRMSQTSGGSALARRASQGSGLGSLGMVKSRSSDLIGHHKGSKHKSRGRHQHSTTTSRK